MLFSNANGIEGFCGGTADVEAAGGGGGGAAAPLDGGGGGTGPFTESLRGGGAGAGGAGFASLDSPASLRMLFSNADGSEGRDDNDSFAVSSDFGLAGGPGGGGGGPAATAGVFAGGGGGSEVSAASVLRMLFNRFGGKVGLAGCCGIFSFAELVMGPGGGRGPGGGGVGGGGAVDCPPFA